MAVRSLERDAVRVHDPVCGAALDPRTAVACRVLGETAAYFCSNGCRERFERLGIGAVDATTRLARFRGVVLPLADPGPDHGPTQLERLLTAVPGVRHAAVSRSERLVLVAYDPLAVTVPAIVRRLRAAGYAVRTDTARLEIRDLRCYFCARVVEAALGAVAGVLRAHADPEAGHARVEYVDGLVATDDLVEAVAQAGFRADVPRRR